MIHNTPNTPRTGIIAGAMKAASTYKADQPIEDSRRKQKIAWKLDKLDPDNWFVIPGFNIKPAETKFEGFKYPIVFPGANDYAIRRHIRTTVFQLRFTAKREFSVLDDLWYQYFNYCDPLKERIPTKKNIIAFAYGESMLRLREAITGKNSIAWKFEKFAAATSLIAHLSTVGPAYASVTNRIKARRDRKNKSGSRTSVFQVAQFMNTLNMAKLTFKVQIAEASEYFGVDERTIYRRLKKARTEKLIF